MEALRAFLSKLGFTEIEGVAQLEKFEAFLPLLTFVLFIYAVYKMIAFARLKHEYNQLQAQMDRVLLREKVEQEKLDAKADLDAFFVKEEGAHPQLQIVNRNKSLATNVRIDFPEGNNLIIQKDIESTFPLPTLNMYKPVNLSIAVYNNAPRKILVKLIWDDGFKMKNEKIIRASY